MTQPVQNGLDPDQLLREANALREGTERLENRLKHSKLRGAQRNPIVCRTWSNNDVGSQDTQTENMPHLNNDAGSPDIQIDHMFHLNNIPWNDAVKKSTLKLLNDCGEKTKHIALVCSNGTGTCNISNNVG
jgi:hypothetical protein